MSTYFRIGWRRPTTSLKARLFDCSVLFSLVFLWLINVSFLLLIGLFSIFLRLEENDIRRGLDPQRQTRGRGLRSGRMRRRSIRFGSIIFRSIRLIRGPQRQIPTRSLDRPVGPSVAPGKAHRRPGHDRLVSLACRRRPQL